MPNIEDLKTDGSKKQPYIPSLKVVSDDTPKRKIPGLVQGESGIIVTPKSARKPMSYAKKETPTTENRVAADFSGIPMVDKKDENYGIDERVSIEHDILKPGGMFDKYKQEKLKEMEEDVEAWRRNAEAADETGNLADDMILLQPRDDDNNNEAETKDKDVDTKETENISQFPGSDDIEPLETDMQTTISQSKSYRAISLEERKEEENMSPKESENNEIDVMDMVEVEDTLEESVDTEEEELVDVVDDESEDPEDDVKVNVKIEEYPDAEEEVGIIEESKPATIKETPKTVTKTTTDSKIGNTLDKVARSYMTLPSEDDEDGDENEVVVEDDEADQSDVLKSLITEKLKPVSKKIDISGFTIAKKGTTSNNILKTESTAVAKWVLPNTGTVIQMREISGANMELIRANMERQPSDVRGALKIIYDSIVSPKPSSFETWLKSTAYADFDNLFMAAYIASFSDANYLPIDCKNKTCGKPYLTDNINIMDMVKFVLTDEEKKKKEEDDNFKGEAEKKFWDLYRSDLVESKGLYTTEVVPISEHFAIGFREPSIYSVLIENAYFNEEFVRRFAQVIGYLPYIDAIYSIDYANNALIPVEYQTFSNNIAKTARSKVRRYDQVINTFSPDENAMVIVHMNAINTRVNWYSFVIPETTCPNCGNVNPESEEQLASSLLFLRNRLGLLATI